jgi:hypothetical protein
MGTFMKEHDIYIGSLLEDLNLRFAPSQGSKTYFGGIEEMVALQKEFKIFKKGRSFETSCALLNLGARNNELKELWKSLLRNLCKHPSSKGNEHGDDAIVNAIIRNLGSAAPLPVYFTSHNMGGDERNIEVKITPKSRPLHYMEHDYMTISLPMQSISAAEKAAAKRKSRG